MKEECAGSHMTGVVSALSIVVLYEEMGEYFCLNLIQSFFGIIDRMSHINGSKKFIPVFHNHHQKGFSSGDGSYLAGGRATSVYGLWSFLFIELFYILPEGPRV